ncbi:williams-beuren syndrome critical region protein [Rhizoctonia solani 123E]|uniref:Williams-beuren syndrome critical region protein n=1 Tax=Rhizoctonia solani 123E TaxID=1423351 RepID=A0A074RRE8_9AGAM|nr:williams-beuren syndrome critical region protein [Rhizoctonia solani 123E]
MSRPEYQAPPEIYYNDVEAKKYTGNTRNQEIQAQMTLRALELLNLPEGGSPFLLDIGCGSGLSGEILDEHGYNWVGVDISPSMLEVALEREVEGDLFLQDIGQGFGFRPGSFDGAISVSVLQWLCNADASTHSPPARLARFFQTLHASLTRSARAVLQFYPQSDDQIQLIMGIAMKSGFQGGLVIDYPNSRKAKKYFLCLFSGGSSEGGASKAKVELPRGLDGEDPNQERENVRFEKRREKFKSRQKRRNIKDKDSRDWILRKKELYRKRGKESVPNDSKYTGRQRKPVF